MLPPLPGPHPTTGATTSSEHMAMTAGSSQCCSVRFHCAHELMRRSTGLRVPGVRGTELSGS